MLFIENKSEFYYTGLNGQIKSIYIGQFNMTNFDMGQNSQMCLIYQLYKPAFCRTLIIIS